MHVPESALDCLTNVVVGGLLVSARSPWISSSFSSNQSWCLQDAYPRVSTAYKWTCFERLSGFLLGPLNGVALHLNGGRHQWWKIVPCCNLLIPEYLQPKLHVLSCHLKDIHNLRFCRFHMDIFPDDVRTCIAKSQRRYAGNHFVVSVAV